VPEKVITMGRKVETALLRGTTSAPIGGDYREIKFMCKFSADAVNGGAPPAPKPEIRVSITTRAPAYLYEVEIIPPGGNQEVLRSRPRDGRVPWARRAIVQEGRPQVAPRSTARRAFGESAWELDDPFGDFGGGIGGVFDDPRDPGGGIGGGGGGGGGRRQEARTGGRLIPQPTNVESGRCECATAVRTTSSSRSGWITPRRCRTCARHGFRSS
jgi:hypothetical protein